MKILLATHVFAPSIGGIESSSLDLALAFAKLGHEVRVITQTLSNDPADDHGLKVIRRPNQLDLLRAIHWSDVFFQKNISLLTAWPLIFIRRPWVVATATWLTNPAGSTDRRSYLKRLALRFATNIYNSKATADHVGYQGIVIPNPCDGEIFRVISGITRERSLVFIGRLVSDKGCDLLIQSVARLRDAGLALPLTIIGSGPEEGALKKLVAELKLNDIVHFAGALRGDALARELNRHEVLVVPSRWAEPFGIVALEGIACGCLVVGSAGGGLPDAIGQCGVLFKNGDAADLARAIREIIENQDLAARCRQAVPQHINDHKSETIAGRYLEIFERVFKDHRDSGRILPN
jgi:glycosyltransferase involved in cell wall biosynthesis